MFNGVEAGFAAIGVAGVAAAVLSTFYVLILIPSICKDYDFFCQIHACAETRSI